MARDPERRPAPIGGRGGVLLGLAALAVWGYSYLGLTVGGMVPGEGGLQVVLRFFSRALSPALTSEADFVPPGAPPLLLGALEAAGTTLVFAAAAMSLAVVLGLVLGFFASTAWWAGDPVGLGLAKSLISISAWLVELAYPQIVELGLDRQHLVAAVRAGIEIPAGIDWIRPDPLPAR